MSKALLVVAAILCVASMDTAEATKKGSVAMIQQESEHGVALNEKAHRVDLEFVKKAVHQKNEYMIVDARPLEYLMVGGPMIPRAIHLPENSAEDFIKKAIPNKDMKILVYCGGIKCPAGTNLANTLINLGYKMVYEFPGGIKAWQDAGLSTVQKPS